MKKRGRKSAPRELPHRLRFDRVTLVAGLALAAAFVPFTLPAAASVILQVEAADKLPGFHFADLPRYLAVHMAEAGPPHPLAVRAGGKR